MLTDPPVVNAGATVLYSQQPSDLIKWYLSLADGKEVYWVFAISPLIFTINAFYFSCTNIYNGFCTLPRNVSSIYNMVFTP